MFCDLLNKFLKVFRKNTCLILDLFAKELLIRILKFYTAIKQMPLPRISFKNKFHFHRMSRITKQAVSSNEAMYKHHKAGGRQEQSTKTLVTLRQLDTSGIVVHKTNTVKL